jgi:1-deoxy-D-xylulose-5-phosphate synthase
MMSVFKSCPSFSASTELALSVLTAPPTRGIYDIAYLRSIPNIVLMAPKDEAELQRMLVTGINYTKGPIAVRYPRGNGVRCPADGRGLGAAAHW